MKTLYDPLNSWEDHQACWRMQYRGSLGQFEAVHHKHLFLKENPSLLLQKNSLARANLAHK